ncbi:hypothetical protein PVAP13_6KG199700 [Panicum virgatum]|uniref:Uncharacterized protein n=2 Tax=Panicum virgatum TaxID=38727 RepID=A0A8T0REY4_PANVG|nr:hypothetical protein PVAP13_6KG199700 [Panicum virgatum]
MNALAVMQFCLFEMGSTMHTVNQGNVEPSIPTHRRPLVNLSRDSHSPRLPSRLLQSSWFAPSSAAARPRRGRQRLPRPLRLPPRFAPPRGARWPRRRLPSCFLLVPPPSSSPPAANASHILCACRHGVRLREVRVGRAAAAAVVSFGVWRHRGRALPRRGHDRFITGLPRRCVPDLRRRPLIPAPPRAPPGAVGLLVVGVCCCRWSPLDACRAARSWRSPRNDLLLIRYGGESFRIIDKTKRDDATAVIQREEWPKSRQDVEKHFRKLRDLDYLNWL